MSVSDLVTTPRDVSKSAFRLVAESYTESSGLS